MIWFNVFFIVFFFYDYNNYFSCCCCCCEENASSKCSYNIFALEVTEAKRFSMWEQMKGSRLCAATMSSNVHVAPCDPCCVSLFLQMKPRRGIIFIFYFCFFFSIYFFLIFWGGIRDKTMKIGISAWVMFKRKKLKKKTLKT